MNLRISDCRAMTPYDVVLSMWGASSGLLPRRCFASAPSVLRMAKVAAAPVWGKGWGRRAPSIRVP